MKNGFIRKVSLILAIVMCFALTACASGGTSTSSGKSASNVGVYATLYAPVNNWDPSIEFSQGNIVLANMYESLLRYNPSTDSFVNVIAESYSKSSDGLTWTFKIRKGMTFHDGTPVNAAAVKFSFERTITMGKGAAFIWDPVNSFDAPDDNTLVVNLKYAAALDLIVSSPYGAFVMSPTAVKAHDDTWLSAGNDAGSGPYCLDSTKNNEQAVLKKFDKYWGGWKDGQFDKVVIQKTSESSTRRQMLEAGEADFVSALPVEDVNALKNNPKFTVQINPSYTNLYFSLNTQKGPLKDKLVRQALSYAFPYDDVITSVMGGYASQSVGPVPKGLWGHSDDIMKYTYNLDKAKQLLTQAGYPNGGFTLVLTYPTGDELERKCAELYQSSLAKLGITLTIQAMTEDMQEQKAQSTNADDHQDIGAEYWWTDVPGPYTYLYNIFHTQDPFWNWTYYNNPTFDKLIDDANSISGADRAKATQMFIEAQKTLVDDAAAVYVFDMKNCCVFNKTVGGYVDNPAYQNVIFFYDCYRTK